MQSFIKSVSTKTKKLIFKILSPPNSDWGKTGEKREKYRHDKSNAWRLQKKNQIKDSVEIHICFPSITRVERNAISNFRRLKMTRDAPCRKTKTNWIRLSPLRCSRRIAVQKLVENTKKLETRSFRGSLEYFLPR